MGKTTRSITVLGAGALAVSSLTACGGTSAKAAATAPTGTVAVSTAASTPSTTPAPTPKPSFAVANGIKSAAFKAALPTPAELGVGTTGYDAPVADDQDRPDMTAQDVPQTGDLTCESLSQAGRASDARNFADEFISPSDFDKAVAIYYASGRQYDLGGGAILFQQIETQVHAPACATSTSTTADGETLNHKVSVRAQNGLGDQADLVKEVVTASDGGGGAVESDTLVIRYGDAVVVMSIQDRQARVQNYDLIGKAKAYAAKLGLH